MEAAVAVVLSKPRKLKRAAKRLFESCPSLGSKKEAKALLNKLLEEGKLEKSEEGLVRVSSSFLETASTRKRGRSLDEGGGGERTRQKKMKKQKKQKKRKKDEKNVEGRSAIISESGGGIDPSSIRHILAPMVGASELPFRLLCRKYGATIAYTPMISSARFCLPSEQAYRDELFQTAELDRPLVAHFSANNPEEMAKAAKIVEPECDAIDLNLGCPQRVAYVGHYGSYLLGDKDRDLVLSIVKETSAAVSVPVFVKIRLLDTVEETCTLVGQLRDAGAKLVAIHARYRASFERNSAGARDGPAMLDQVKYIKERFPNFPIISNGNIKTFQDCEKNLAFTKADGVMSAEGILDNPALFLDSLKGSNDDYATLKEFSADKTNLATEYLQLVS